MTWLLKMFPGQWAVYAAVLAASFAMGGTAAWKYQGARLDAVKAEYAGFVAQVKILREAAQKAATEQTARDKAAKERADNENTRTLATLRAANQRLRDARSHSNYLPAPAASASSPTTATIDRAKFESAMGRLDRGGQAIIDRGDKAIIDLNSAKLWAKP